MQKRRQPPLSPAIQICIEFKADIHQEGVGGLLSEEGDSRSKVTGGGCGGMEKSGGVSERSE